MEIYSRNKKKLNKKGFSLVEIVVVIAIMAVLLAVLAPSLLRYVEDSRMQRDESAVDEVAHTVHLAMADPVVFDAVYSYAIPNNYTTYTDSSGVYGAKYEDDQFWAPDGSGRTVTVTFNPDSNGDYNIAEGVVNNMTSGNGSLSDARTLDVTKQCTLTEMGNQELYTAIKKTIGTTLEETSATYKNSSYTVFIKFDTIGAQRRVDVYGEWNGTNLSPNSTVSNSSGNSTGQPDDNVPTPPPSQSEPSQPNIPPADLGGSGGTVPGGGGTTPVPHSHNYTTVTTPATCTKDGLETKTCSCGDTHTEVIPATGHSETTIPGTEPTCTKSGKTESKQCSVCNTITQAGTSIAALGHNYTSSTQAATCTTADKTIYTCSNCGDSYTENGNALGHDIIKQPGEPATCTKTGLTEGEHCSRCDYKIAQTTTDALGHEYNSVTKAATCTEGGSTITTCSRCGDSSTTTTEALGHNYTAKVTTKATCTTTGVRTYTCSRCGNSYTESIAATGHLHTEIRNADTSTGYTGDTYCKDCGKIISYGKYIIPEGGTYTTADGTVYEEGDAFPSTVTDGDTYSYGEYEYKYNYRLYSSAVIGRWEANISQNGWGVRYLYDRANPAQMLESINGKPITSMRNTFYQCRSVVVAPAIPSTVTDMYYAFANCYKLTTVGKLPLGLKNLIYAFSGCQVLTKAPAIPSTVTEMSSCFSGCKALTDISAVKIPSAVTDLDNIFSGCKSLVDASNIVIGSNVVFLDCGFVNCTSLKKAPNVSNTTASMLNTFLNCTSLTGTVKFNGNPRRNNSIFEGVDFEAQNLTLAGSASALDTLGSTGNNYCSECNGKCSNITEHHVCTISGGICTICGETATVIESTHNYANSQNYIVLGYWDYSNAKSVNITIQYETETSCDWISIVEGSDYLAGSSYTQTKNYLNTSGNIVSATGTSSSVKFSGSSRTIKTFTDVNMLQGTVIFRSDSSVQKWGAKITITPNY